MDEGVGIRAGLGLLKVRVKVLGLKVRVLGLKVRVKG
jgi:hypothetical protein